MVAVAVVFGVAVAVGVAVGSLLQAANTMTIAILRMAATLRLPVIRTASGQVNSDICRADVLTQSSIRAGRAYGFNAE